jgi:transcriptional regulator with XRE-family HTH domain
MAKLTPEACRAGRALLGWSMHQLRQESGLSISAVQQVESGGEFFRATEEKIVAAFARHGVEITNGDGTGARLRKAGK